MCIYLCIFSIYLVSRSIASKTFQLNRELLSERVFAFLLRVIKLSNFMPKPPVAFGVTDYPSISICLPTPSLYFSRANRFRQRLVRLRLVKACSKVLLLRIDKKKKFITPYSLWKASVRIVGRG